MPSPYQPNSKAGIRCATVPHVDWPCPGRRSSVSNVVDTAPRRNGESTNAGGRGLAIAHHAYRVSPARP
jgi:hypothetical protein